MAMMMMMVQVNIIVSSMRLEMWPQWGGVIGDKVTLMFRLFNTHLFTHTLLCPPFKRRFFFLGKSNVPRKGTQWPGLGVSNVLPRVQLSTPCGLTTQLTFYAIVNFFPRFCIGRRFSTFFSRPLQSEPWAAFSAEEHGLPDVLNLLICTRLHFFFANQLIS